MKCPRMGPESGGEKRVVMGKRRGADRSRPHALLHLDLTVGVGAGAAGAGDAPSPAGPLGAGLGGEAGGFTPREPQYAGLLGLSWLARLLASVRDLMVISSRLAGIGTSGPWLPFPLLSAPAGWPKFAWRDGPVPSGIDRSEPLPAGPLSPRG